MDLRILWIMKSIGSNNPIYNIILNNKIYSIIESNVWNYLMIVIIQWIIESNG